MTNPIHETYGNRLRVRACGICIHESKLLLVRHNYLSTTGFWSPPGGGIEFEEPAASCIKREFREETGLEVNVGDFLFACEFIRSPLHGIELFFHVTLSGGTLITGYDPEMTAENRVILEVKFMDWNEIKAVPAASLHGVLSLVDELHQLPDLRGYFRI